MKHKKKTAIAVLLLIVFVIGAYFANAFFGNPVSRILAGQTAKRCVEEQYPEFYVEDVGFDLKTGGYCVHLASAASADSRFTLYIDMMGKLLFDSYESRILHRGNTADRLNMEYRALADRVLFDPELPYKVDIGFGELVFWYDNVSESVKEYSFAMPMSQLELDKQYDVSSLGAEAGRMVVYVADENVSLSKLTEILVDLTARLDTNGVSFYMIDLVLESPRPTDGSDCQRERVEVKDFLYTDIGGDGLMDRVAASNEAAIAYYAEQDAIKTQESSIK